MTMACTCGFIHKPDCVWYRLSDLTTKNAQARELEEFNKNWALMKLALADYQKGELHEISLITILGGIIDPPEITEDDIKWGKEALATYDKLKEGKEE